MATEETPETANSAVATVNGKPEEVDAIVPFEPKLPTRKDASLKEFLAKMDDYAPIVSFIATPGIFQMRSLTVG